MFEINIQITHINTQNTEFYNDYNDNTIPRNAKYNKIYFSFLIVWVLFAKSIGLL